MPTYRNVGFFGHRSQRLQEIGASSEALQGRIESTLSKLHWCLADEEGGGVRFLTGLADGTDRLAAKSADRLGYVRQCIIPGTLEAELEGVDDGDARKFAEGAETILELAGGETDRREVAPEAYRIQMDALIAHSDLIFVVWDGQAPRGVEGGTVRAVSHAANQRIPVVWLDPRDNGLRLLRVEALTEQKLEQLNRHPTDLQGGEIWGEVGVEELPGAVEGFPGLKRQGQGSDQSGERPREGAESPRGYCSTLRRIKDNPRKPVGLFRRYAGFSDRLLSSLVAGNWQGIRDTLLLKPTVGKPYKGPALEGLPARLAMNLDGYRRRFSAADVLATVQGNRQRGTIWLTFLLGALAVFAAAAGSVHGFPGYKLHIWGYVEVGAILAILWLVWIARRLRSHSQFLGARHLAEQLRYHAVLVPLLARSGYLVQPRYRLDPGNANEDSVPAFGSWEDREFRAAFRELGLPRSTGSGTNRIRLIDQIADLKSYVGEVLEDQQAFHRKRARRYERLHRHMERLSVALFAATGLAAVSHILLHAAWLVIITTFFPALGAALHGIANQLEFRRLADKYGHVDERLGHYQNVLRDIGEEPSWENLADLRWVAERMVELLADETQNWRSLLRHNQASIPS